MNHTVVVVFPPGFRHVLLDELEHQAFPEMDKARHYIDHVLDDMKQEENLRKRGDTFFSYTFSWDDSGHIEMVGDHVSVERAAEPGGLGQSSRVP
jgi:hypothetical protein